MKRAQELLRSSVALGLLDAGSAGGQNHTGALARAAPHRARAPRHRAVADAITPHPLLAGPACASVSWSMFCGAVIKFMNIETEAAKGKKRDQLGPLVHFFKTFIATAHQSRAGAPPHLRPGLSCAWLRRVAKLLRPPGAGLLLAARRLR